MTRPSLVELMKMAKTDKEAAGKYILDFANEKFDLNAKEIKINSSAVSLNSVNGFLVLPDEKELFFKFHSEEGEEEVVGEYYRAGILEKAGFPVISPLYESSVSGEQFLIYPKVDQPTFFDVFGDLDGKFLQTGKYDEHLLETIREGETQLNYKCVEVAKKTLKIASADEVEKESVWQLFYGRLESDKTTPRVDLFYKDKDIALPNGENINFEELKNYSWVINGKKYDQKLAEIIEDAKKIVNPKSQEKWPVITAHGDDHNGNKFFFGAEENSGDKNSENPILKYFDPAFAGENIPALLAFVKTTFHDTLAHPFYFYEPKKIEEQAEINFVINKEDKIIFIDHNFTLAEKAPFRKELLEIKFKTLWKPLISELKEKNLLPENAKEFIKKSLFCCPILCLNLINPDHFSPKSSVFALSRAVELGTSAPENEIDELIDSVL